MLSTEDDLVLVRHQGMILSINFPRDGLFRSENKRESVSIQTNCAEYMPYCSMVHTRAITDAKATTDAGASVIAVSSMHLNTQGPHIWNPPIKV